MKRLKGALKIYSKQDIPTMVVILLIVLGFSILNLNRTNYNIEFCSKMSECLNFLIYYIVFDYSFSFSSRYVMYSNFNNCRNLFYKSQVILILLKSIAVTLMVNLVIVMELTFCKFKNYNYFMDFMGNKVVNIHGIELVKLMILIFIAITLFWSISFIIASIERLGFIMAIITLLAMWILKDMFFGSIKVLQSYSYVQVVFLCIFVIFINFIVAWFIIKKKSKIGDSWFIKFSKAFYSNDNV